MYLLGGGLSLILAIALCIHAVRSGQQLYWVLIILVFQPLGGIVYLFAIVLPELVGGRTARIVGQAARATLDPGRDYRAAKAAYDETPTVANSLRLAQAVSAQGRHDEAERLYREAAQGIHAEDPTLLLGHAHALVELGRPAEALDVLAKLGPNLTPQASLALARAYEGLGRTADADAAYNRAVERLPGLEAISRYAAFLARGGQREQAQEMLTEIDRRIARADPTFRKEGRTWRALAAEAIG